jgi:hypothetical protein
MNTKRLASLRKQRSEEMQNHLKRSEDRLDKLEEQVNSTKRQLSSGAFKAIGVIGYCIFILSLPLSLSFDLLKYIYYVPFDVWSYLTFWFHYSKAIYLDRNND